MDKQNGRKKLEFARTVVEQFKFLETRCAYDLIQCEDTKVGYRSKLMSINLYHDRFSYEIELKLRRVDSDNRDAYSLPAIFGAMVPHYTGQAFFQASDRSGVFQCVSTIAKLIRTNCIELITGKSDAILAVKTMHEEIAHKTTCHYVLGSVKEDAQKAWENKDYEKVVRLYKPIESELSNVEQKRLAFAQKHMGELQ